MVNARNIGGVSFNGSADINLPGVNITGNQNTTGSAATLTTARTINGVSFDGSANITIAEISGNAGSATVLQTARTINGVSFNGSNNITVADSTKLPLAGGTMAGAITFAAGQTWPTFNQNTTGSAATWTTARTLWGQSVNGSANVTSPLLPAAGTESLPAFSTSGDTNTGMYFPAADTIAFSEGGVEVMRIDANGRVGIGTTSTGLKLEIASSTINDGIKITNTSTANSTAKSTRVGFHGTDTAGTVKNAANIYASPNDANFVNSSMLLQTLTNNIITTRATISDRMELYSAKVGGFNDRTLNLDGPSISSPGIGFHAPANSTAGIFMFEGSQGGFYCVNSTNSGFVPIWASAFNIGSDYRLKTDIVNLQSGLQDIMNLSPKKYTLFDSDKEARGFIAHEVSPHIPEAVSGEFNAEDERGFPVYQTLDPASILATAVAAIQELKVLVDQQAIEIQQLKEKLNA